MVTGLTDSAIVFNAITVPIADGGEGTLDALATEGTRREVATVPGPFGKPLDAPFLFDEERREAVIELAAVAGHDHAAGLYDPDRASTAGAGRLLDHAVSLGARHVIVALGGSITVDGGAGLLEALGARFMDNLGGVVARPAGRALARIAKADLAAARREDISITVAADVTNPLTGRQGAAAVFGPQKGVEDVAAFDHALGHFDAVLAKAKGADPVGATPGAGAAGGVLVGLSAVAPVHVVDGFRLVAERRMLAEKIDAADLVMTGEGSLDAQSLSGKGPVAIARMAAAAGTPTIIFAGRVAVDAKALAAHEITAAFSILRGPVSLEDALADAFDSLAATATSAFRLFAAR